MKNVVLAASIAVSAHTIAATQLTDKQENTMLYACMEGTRARLDNPAAAQFSLVDAPSDFKSLGKNNLYRVRFEGRIRNQFNALVLATFECTVKLEPDGARAMSTKQIR